MVELDLLAPARERVQEILEHRGRGERVQHLGAFLAAQARALGGLLGGEGGEPLVPQQDRQAERRIELVGERAHRLAARPLAAVHVERPAEHQRARRALAR